MLAVATKERKQSQHRKNDRPGQRLKSAAMESSRPSHAIVIGACELAEIRKSEGANQKRVQTLVGIIV